MLLAFIVLGMFFGSDGFAKIDFDNYKLTEDICTVALVCIMFYGGFGTKWSSTKPIAVRALLLSSVGTVLTAAIMGLFCGKFSDRCGDKFYRCGIGILDTSFKKAES